MQAREIIRRLGHGAETLRTAVTGLGADAIRFKPSAEDWSILEVVCHLADEEVEDFRTRLRMTLEQPGEPWPPIDPVGTAAARKYQEQDFDAALDRFVRERAASMHWLEALGEVDWAKAYTHPSLGAIPAGALLVSWAAHDELHLRQINRRRFQWLERLGAPYSTLYAGEW
jgi:hypothetical protein